MKNDSKVKVVVGANTARRLDRNAKILRDLDMHIAALKSQSNCANQANSQ